MYNIDWYIKLKFLMFPGGMSYYCPVPTWHHPAGVAPTPPLTHTALAPSPTIVRTSMSPHQEQKQCVIYILQKTYGK